MIEPGIEIDTDKAARNALELAQFAFVFKPLSVNEYLMPVGSRMIMSHAAQDFKQKVIRILEKQKTSHDWSWVCKDRYFSLWIILNRQRVRIDPDNSVKLILDSFVAAGIVPDDKHACDTRQLYTDFPAGGKVPMEYAWAVLIRWGNKLPEKKMKR